MEVWRSRERRGAKWREDEEAERPAEGDRDGDGLILWRAERLEDPSEGIISREGGREGRWEWVGLNCGCTVSISISPSPVTSSMAASGAAADVDGRSWS